MRRHYALTKTAFQIAIHIRLDRERVEVDLEDGRGSGDPRFDTPKPPVARDHDGTPYHAGPAMRAGGSGEDGHDTGAVSGRVASGFVASGSGKSGFC